MCDRSTAGGVVLLLIVSAAVTARLFGAGADAQTPDGGVVTEARIAPDGLAVAFTVEDARTGPTSPAATNVWRVSFAGDAPQQLTSGSRQASHLRWSADGQQLAFLSRSPDGQDSARVMLMPAAGGAARALTGERTAVTSFEWRPGDREIAYLASSPTQTGAQLALVDVESGRTRSLSNRDGMVAAFDWAPSGSELVLLVDEPGGGSRIVVHSVAGSSRDVATLDGSGRGLAWSPDGTTIAWLTDTPRSGSPARIETVQASGGMVRQVVGLPGTPAFIGWSAGRSLSIALRIDGNSQIDLLDVSSGARQTVLPTSIVFIAGAPSWSRDGTRYAVVGSGGDHGPEVFAGSLPPPTPRDPDTVGAPPPPVRRISFFSR
jgi:Tol biopolymer transport system component